MEPTHQRKYRKCPNCGGDGIPMVYGMPPYFPLGMAEERGLISLAGCLVAEDDPNWICPSCQTTFDGPDPSRAIRAAIQHVEHESDQ